MLIWKKSFSNLDRRPSQPKHPLKGGPAAAATAAKSLQSCLTLCDPGDGSPPGSPVPGILQARTLEWVVISFSNAAAAAAKSLQSCPTLCDPIDDSPPGSAIPGDSPDKNTGVGCHFFLQCMKVKSESEVAQSWPTLCNPMYCSPPCSSIHGIFQARVREWGAIGGAIAFSGFMTGGTTLKGKGIWSQIH